MHLGVALLSAVGIVLSILAFSEHASALVIGVPVVAIALIKLVALIVGVVSVPFTGLVQLINHDRKTKFLFSAVILSSIALILFLLFRHVKPINSPTGYVSGGQLILIIVRVVVIAFLFLSVPVTAVVLFTRNIFSKEWGRRFVIQVSSMTTLTLALLLGSVVALISMVRDGIVRIH